ncbi:MAG: ABC transporter permease, partial [Coriobacteriales bacterium]|nr:ABC transporter permease [Coriobacteriales bacterium]
HTAEEQLAHQETDAILTLSDGVLTIEVEGTDTSHTAAVMNVVNMSLQELAAKQREELSEELSSTLEEMSAALQETTSALAQTTSALAQAQVAGGVPPTAPPTGAERSAALLDAPPTSWQDLTNLQDLDTDMLVEDVEYTYLHGSEDWTGFDFFGPAFIGIFIFVFVFITSGMSLITERSGGTMERLLTTPIKPWQLVLGYCLGFGLVSLIQAAIVLWACIALIGFPNMGSLLLVVCVTVSLALVSLTLGLLVSGLARTPFQVIQFMLVLVIPQVLLSGIFDLSQTPEWMQFLSACFPITYGAEALRDIMLRGSSLTEVAPQLALLWGFIAAFFALASVSFSKRKGRE